MILNKCIYLPKYEFTILCSPCSLAPPTSHAHNAGISQHVGHTELHWYSGTSSPQVDHRLGYSLRLGLCEKESLLKKLNSMQ